MSDLKDKMHQIRLRLGVWGAYSAPQTPSWIKGGLLLREGEGMGKGRGRLGGEGKGGRGREFDIRNF